MADELSYRRPGNREVGNYSLVGAQDDRLMRMLKRTSKHHQPAHLAAAVALGIVVGLVPKANLLALGLYLGLLLLPIHTWLALAVSALVACIAGYLDPLTHPLGAWLLRQPMLRPLWYRLDNTAILPWLQLHNTVVLGNLVSGMVLAGPTYLVALRLFERMRWRMPATQVLAEVRPIAAQGQSAEPALVRPPKFISQPQRQPTEFANDSARAGSEHQALEPEPFEPAHDAAAIINSWHMGLATDKSHVRHSVLAISGPTSSETTADRNPSADASRGAGNQYFAGMPLDLPPRPPMGQRSEIVDSLDLAHGANEVLAWVDELLDECLTDDTQRIVAHDLYPRSTSPTANAPTQAPEPFAHAGSSEGPWLMETTIEVVRWGEVALPEIKPTSAPHESSAGTGETAQPQPQQVQPQHVQSQQAAAGETVSPENSTSLPVQRKRPVQDRDADNQRASIVQFIQPGVNAKRGATGSPAQSPGNGAAESQSGECLGFLLGHLRQEREGKSS